MSMTKNPFERQPGRKLEKETKEVTTGGRMGQASRGMSSDLPPTRASGVKASDKKKIPGRSIADENKKKPAPKHAAVSHTGPPSIATPAWMPAAMPAKPGAVPAQAKTSPLGSQPNENAYAVAGSDGKEVAVSTSLVTDDYTKQYAKRVEDSEKSIIEKAEEKMTAENYQKVYLAQQQVEAEQQLQAKKNEEFISERNKKNEEILAMRNKAQRLQANIAALKMRLGKEGPDVDRGLYASIDEMMFQLNEINPIYWT